jgi:hypothetical protein
VPTNGRLWAVFIGSLVLALGFLIGAGISIWEKRWLSAMWRMGCCFAFLSVTANPQTVFDRFKKGHFLKPPTQLAPMERYFNTLAVLCMVGAAITWLLRG